MMQRTYRAKPIEGKRGIDGGITFFYPRHLLVILLLALTVGTAVYLSHLAYKWAETCPYFSINDIKITGVKKLTREQVLQITGIKKGENFFHIDSESLKSALEKNPWVKSAVIEKHFPDTLYIHVTERTPFALVKVGQKLFLLDDSGVPFKPLEANDNFTGPVISGVIPEGSDLHDLLKNARLLIDREKMSDALDIVKKSKHGVRALGFHNISQIDFHGDDGLVIYTADKGVPFFLSRENLLKQFERAERILVRLYNSGQYQKVLQVNVGYGKDLALARLKSK